MSPELESEAGPAGWAGPDQSESTRPVPTRTESTWSVPTRTESRRSVPTGTEPTWHFPAEPGATSVRPRTSVPTLRGAAQPLFLSPSDVVELIRQRGAGEVMAGIAEAIREEFRRWSAFDKSARVACHSDFGVIELMPIADDKCFSFKYVNGHPGNPARGLSTVMAFGVLADVRTGAPTLVSELTLTTALRTAAMSALAGRTLARPDSRTMALIGNGAQAAFQAIAFARMVGIRTVRLFDIDPSATARLAVHLERNGIEWTRCTNTADAVRGADVVTTITADKTLATIILASMLEPGMHLNAVGGDCPGKVELAPEVLNRGDVFVEFEPQTRIEGDIQQMPPSFAVTELWRVLTGQAPGRRDREAITIFDSVGFALEDFAALRWLHAAALQTGLGRPIELLPQPGDPKDLFSAFNATV